MQAWLSERPGLDVDLWIAGLGVTLAWVVAVVLVVGILLRINLALVTLLLAAYIGGAVGNQVELGLFEDVTDWFWISGDGQFIVFNFADVMILGSSIAFGGLVVVGLVALLFRLAVWFWASVRAPAVRTPVHDAPEWQGVDEAEREIREARQKSAERSQREWTKYLLWRRH